MTDIGKLYIVATPIGNLSDMTFRAIDVLKSVDIILAEDTRHCARLLNHYQIPTKTWSLHNFNETQQVQKVLELLRSGKTFALISDAGTPLISDPGWALVHAAREQAIDVIAVPGACALIAALSIAGLPTQNFQFFGFLPVKSMARQTALEAIKYTPMTSIFYESPHRLIDMLEDCQQVLGDARRCCLVKELTKIHETVHCGVVLDLLAWLHEVPERLKGEFVILVEPHEVDADIALEKAKVLLKTLQGHLPLKTAAKIVAEYCDVNKNQLYEFGLSSNLRKILHSLESD